ncbi:MAG: Na+/H+ antiporter NhaA [Halieaceae bacterium]|jgi:NhaA family Na+:H+ antiporter|nr:Na+/H+ antiporter NhaA [Halieaceae bacterium]
MTIDAAGSEKPTGLPSALLDRVRRPFTRFLAIEAAAGAVLLLATLAALVLANSPWAHLYHEAWEVQVGFQIGSLDFARPAEAWINDALMTLFFFLVSLELKRELVLGELRRPRMAALSIAAAMGGMLIPAALYAVLQAGESGAHGWGTVMATDTAFVVGCLALLGRRIPPSLRVFMLSLAIVDDIGAILVVAVGYSSEISGYALLCALLGIALVRGLAVLGVRGFPLYFLAGAFIWIAIDASGIHATITGVILGLMTPARRWVSDDRLYAILEQVIAHPVVDQDSGDTKDRETLLAAELAAREALSPVERLELGLHPWVGFVIMPLFAFANAGVSLSVENLFGPLSVAIMLGFCIGKPLGVVTFSWVAVRTGIALRPPELSWSLLLGGGFLAGIGFTMALFIANLAFGDALIGNAKLSILLASVLSAVVGLVVLTWATAGGGRNAGTL